MADGNPNPVRDPSIELVVTRRKMKLLTLTEQEAQALQSSSTESSWTLIGSSLSLGAFLNHFIVGLLSPGFGVQRLVILCVFAGGAVLFFMLNRAIQSQRKSILDEIRDSTASQTKSETEEQS